MTFFDKWHFTWRASTRGAANAAILLVILALAGCSRETADSGATAGNTADAAGMAKALRANPNVPPQAKEQMLRNLEQQAQQPANSVNKP